LIIEDTNHPSWVVVADAPIDLNFAMYVANAYDVLPKTAMFADSPRWPPSSHALPAGPAKLAMVQQWQQWWSAMVAEKTVQVERSRQEAERWSTLFSPNAFDNVEPPLGRCLAAVYEEFRQWWELTAGGHTALSYWTDCVPVGNVVNHVSRALGRPVAPFQLTVHFVYLGLATIVEPTPRYAIMSVHPPSRTIFNRQWWTAKIQQLA